MYIRKTEKKDIETVLTLYASAGKFMRENGNGGRIYENMKKGFEK